MFTSLTEKFERVFASIRSRGKLSENDVRETVREVRRALLEADVNFRVVKDFVKENEKLKVKAGLLEGEVLGPKAVTEQLATLPSKDEARAMLLATFMAPLQHFVMLLNAFARELVGVLAAKERKDGG